MKQINLLSLLFAAAMIITFRSQAQEGLIRIPLNTFVKPSADLFDEKGKALSFGELEKKYNKYHDVSNYRPAENKYWQDKKFDVEDLQLHQQMPSQNETVLFDDYLGAVRDLGIYSVYVRPENNKNIRYGLTFGLQVHASLLKAALLRKVGFYQESPKYLHKIKIKFLTLDKMNEFISKSFCENGPSEEAIDCLSLDPFKRGFLSDKNETDFTVIMHGAYLEKFNNEVPGLFDGLTPANGNNLQYLAQSRAFRALAAPFVMGDAGESLNRFSPQAVSIRAGWAQMNFMNSVYFDLLTSHDDMKWILKRYADLEQKDWDEIAAAAHYPECTVRLAKSLLLHRFRNMLQSFFSRSEATSLLKVTIEPLNSINTSCVEAGRVNTETIPEYPQRFSHGPRKSPFETADLIKYMKIATQSAVLQLGLNQLNEKLQVVKVLNQKINGVEFNPDGLRLLQSTSGVLAGVNFNANRIVTTGTFYGSQAPVQLVDSVSISGGIGYQNFFEGLNGIRRNFGASAAYIRTFTHVVPIENMKQADQTAWFKNLKIRSRLQELAAPLKDGKLDQFLTNLKVGEVFTITDSIGAGGSIGWSSSLDALFGFVPGLSASVSFDASKLVVLRQIQYSRVQDGIQVYVRDVDSHMVDADGKEKPDHKQSTSVYGVTFDANYYVNIFKLRAQRSSSDLHTDAFLIKYDANLLKKVDSGEITPTEELQAKIDKQKVFGDKASAALRALIFQSNVDPLYSNFKAQQFEIDHGLKINEIQLKFLWNHATQLDQEHTIKILKTQLPDKVDGGEVKNIPIYLVSNRKGELRGRDLFGFSLEALNAYLVQKFQTNAPQYQTSSQNPSQMPFGFAQWRVIRTDSELSQNREGALPTVSVIEHIWGGWSLKRKQMDQILNELKEQMKEIKIADFPLIPEGALANVTKVDFFRVTSHLSLLPEAMTQIKNLVLASDTINQPVEKVKFLGRFFQKLSEIQGKARPQDQAVYNNLMKLIGNGSLEQGRQNYLMQCEINRRDKGQEQQFTATWSRGTNYECLEPWVDKIIKLSREFPANNIRAQNKWMTEVLYVLDEQIPQAYFLNYLGADKFIYYVELTGFRAGDEDGDLGDYISNSYGEPKSGAPYANGLFSVFANKSFISPVEFEKQGSF